MERQQRKKHQPVKFKDKEQSSSEVIESPVTPTSIVDFTNKSFSRRLITLQESSDSDTETSQTSKSIQSSVDSAAPVLLQKRNRELLRKN